MDFGKPNSISYVAQKLSFFMKTVRNFCMMKKTSDCPFWNFVLFFINHDFCTDKPQKKSNRFFSVLLFLTTLKNCCSHESAILCLNSAEIVVDEVSKWTVWGFMFSSSCQNSSPFSWKMTISVLHKKINWAFQNPNCRLPFVVLITFWLSFD